MGIVAGAGAVIHFIIKTATFVFGTYLTYECFRAGNKIIKNRKSKDNEN